MNSCRIPVAKVRINFVVDSHWSQLNLIDSVVGRMPVTLIGAMQAVCVTTAKHLRIAAV